MRDGNLKTKTRDKKEEKSVFFSLKKTKKFEQAIWIPEKLEWEMRRTGGDYWPKLLYSHFSLSNLNVYINIYMHRFSYVLSLKRKEIQEPLWSRVGSVPFGCNSLNLTHWYKLSVSYNFVGHLSRWVKFSVSTSICNHDQH